MVLGVSRQHSPHSSPLPLALTPNSGAGKFANALGLVVRGPNTPSSVQVPVAATGDAPAEGGQPGVTGRLAAGQALGPRSRTKAKVTHSHKGHNKVGCPWLAACALQAWGAEAWRHPKRLCSESRGVLPGGRGQRRNRPSSAFILPTCILQLVPGKSQSSN